MDYNRLQVARQQTNFGPYGQAIGEVFLNAYLKASPSPIPSQIPPDMIRPMGILTDHLRRLKEALVATQSEVTELVETVTELAQELTEAKENTEKKFAELEKKISETPPPTNEIDLGPLKTAIENLKGPVAEVGKVEPHQAEETEMISKLKAPPEISAEDAARQSV